MCFLLPEKRGPAGPSALLLSWSSSRLWANQLLTGNVGKRSAASELKGCWKLLATGFTELPSQPSCPCHACPCCPGRPKPCPGGITPHKLTEWGLQAVRFAVCHQDSRNPGQRAARAVGSGKKALWSSPDRPAKGRVERIHTERGEMERGQRTDRRSCRSREVAMEPGAEPGCQVLLEAYPRLPCGPLSPLTKSFH